jgi:hypothetical protein
MEKRETSILYLVLGLYTLMISWYYNHSVILLIIHYIFWPACGKPSRFHTLNKIKYYHIKATLKYTRMAFLFY